MGLFMSVSVEVLCLGQQLPDSRREYTITSYYKAFLVDVLLYVDCYHRLLLLLHYNTYFNPNVA